MKSAHYSGAIDGNIKEYLVECRQDGRVAPTFKGYEPFKQLWDLEAIVPDYTSIRLMWSSGRTDEFYIVLDKEKIEGINLRVHSGQPGIHNTQKILTNTDADYWCIEGLNPKVFRR